jgi:hypothetical protein
VVDRRTDLRGYPVVPQPSVETSDRLSDMCRKGHGPGLYEDPKVAAQSNENNGADLRLADAGFGASYSSRAAYSNPFDIDSPTGYTPPASPTVLKPPAGFNHSAGCRNPFDYHYTTSPADGFNGNPLVTIIPPAPETHNSGSDSRKSNTLTSPMMEGENGAKNEKKKIEEMKEKAKKAKAWLLKNARETYGRRAL